MGDPKPGENILYRVKFETREGPVVFFVEARNAVRAHQKGVGLAALHDVDYRGADVDKATDAEAAEYHADQQRAREL